VVNGARGLPGAPDLLASPTPIPTSTCPLWAGGTLIQSAQADSKLVMATNLQSGHPALRQLMITNARPPRHGAATQQLDDIAQATGPGTLYAVDQGPSALVHAIDTSAITLGTMFWSQPKPSTGDLPNDPGLAVVDPTTGVVTHIGAGLTSPKGTTIRPRRHQYRFSVGNPEQCLDLEHEQGWSVRSNRIRLPAGNRFRIRTPTQTPQLAR
jgi:hypothetical protein